MGARPREVVPGDRPPGPFSGTSFKTTYTSPPDENRLLPISFLLMLKLNDNIFCNDNLVIFVLFFFLQFPSLLL